MVRRSDQKFCTGDCRSKAHYATHSQRIKDRAKKWSADNPDAWKKRYSDNPEEFRKRTAQWREQNRERHRAYSREFAKRNPMTVRRRQLSKYGLTPDTYVGMLTNQGGACAICGTTTPSKRRVYFDVDHCHDTGRVRGLLCEICNRVLGLFANSPERFTTAANYLRQSSHAVSPSGTPAR